MPCGGYTIAAMPKKFDPHQLPAFPDLSYEGALWEKGIRFVAGLDEAGRGALAGPVAAAAVILPADLTLTDALHGVNDSKKLTPQLRALYASRIKEIALSWEVGLASHAEIDAYGIVASTRLAMKRAIERMRVKPEWLLIDYLDLPAIRLPATSLVKGDQRSLTIAAASILAKTARDLILCQLEERYPGYGFAEHKGYSTRAHLEALQARGPSPIHRLTFQFRHPPELELPASAAS